MSIAKIAIVSSLMLTLVSCGNNDSKSKRPAASTNPMVANYTWKILNGRSFPAKSLVVVNSEIVVDECSHKHNHFIDRTTTPESLTLRNHVKPSTEMVNVKVFDLGDCHNDLEHEVVNETVRYDLNKSGTSAEVLIQI